MGKCKADIVIGVEVYERKGESWTDSKYTYIKYTVVGLVGVKIGEPRLIHIGLRGVGSAVKYCSLGNFYCRTVTLKLDRDGKYINYLLSDVADFRDKIGSLEAINSSITDMLVFNQKQQLLHSINNSNKAYIDLFRHLATSNDYRLVALEVDIEAKDVSIVSIDGINERVSHFSNYTMDEFTMAEPLFEKLQDNVYVYGDITVLHKCTTNSIILPKECNHLVLIRGSFREIVFGSYIKYISSRLKPFYLEQKLYISKDSGKDFIVALLQSIYFSNEHTKLISIHDEVELKFLDGETFYHVCMDKRNSKVMREVLKDKEIVVY